VVALVLLSSILTGTFTILNQAIATNINVKNRIIALNIAREGFEAVRNLRDTNWLKYSGDRRQKWLCRDSSGNPNACNGGSSTLIDAGTGSYYFVDYDTSVNRYYLTVPSLGEDLDLTSGQDPNDQDEYQLHLDDTNNRYSHTATGSSSPSIFYRQLYLEAINPFEEEATLPTFCNSSSDEADCFNSRLKVRVGVYWLEEGRPRRIFLEGNLFDFFERKNYDPSPV